MTEVRTTYVYDFTVLAEHEREEAAREVALSLLRTNHNGGRIVRVEPSYNRPGWYTIEISISPVKAVED